MATRFLLLSFTATLFTVYFAAQAAFAQQTGPGDPCTSAQNGQYRLSGGTDLGGEGHILSCDGSNWAKIFSFDTDGIFRPSFINEHLCEDGDTIIFDELTGSMACAGCAREWEQGSLPNSNGYRAVTYGAGRFVTTSWNGGNNKLASSSDGLNWIEHPISIGFGISLTYGNGLFIAMTNEDRFVTSPDGINWTERSDNDLYGYEWTSVIYGHAGFVAISNDTTSRVAVSPNGINWDVHNINSTVSGGRWTDITYGNGIYVAVRGWGWSGPGPSIMYSTDGINWTGSSDPDVEGCDGASITYGNGLFVAAACWPHGVMRSTDGENWTRGGTGVPGTIGNAVYGNGLFVILGSWGNPRIYTSTDAVTWSDTPAPSGFGGWFDANAITYGANRFVAVHGDDNASMRSFCF